jgi:hypothetical protein
MKKLFFFLFIPLFAISQEPQKGDNTIVVNGVGFTQIKNALLDSGYFIAEQNADDGTIVTKARNADNGRIFGQRLDRYHIIIYVRVKDSVATFREDYDFKTGEGNRESDRSDFKEVTYWKSKGSVPYHLFEQMDAIAKGFGRPLVYLKK